jgi:HAD superfamily hydrolase (TIGR01509 family)
MKFNGREISGAILDMDGLLIDSEPIHRAYWKKAAAECGFELSDEMHDRLLGRGRKAGVAFIREQYGIDFPVERMTELLNRYEEEFFTREKIPLKKGVPELFALFKERGLKYAVATGAGRKAARLRLGRAGLNPDTLVLCTVDQVTRSKPHPDLFLFAAESLGASPAACVVFEDAENGVVAAQAAGMRACLVPDIQKASVKGRELAEVVLDSLQEAAALFE